MISALFSFLGGSFARAVWGEVSAYFTKKQDHEQEMERLRLQVELDDRNHQRSMESIRLQADLGVRQIEAQMESAVEQESAKAFTAAMKAAGAPTGVLWVDIWNGVIRPCAATIVLILWFLKLFEQSFVMDIWDMDVAAVILGFWFADRTMGKRGK